jgi:hypothetical protein
MEQVIRFAKDDKLPEDWIGLIRITRLLGFGSGLAEGGGNEVGT